jgi:endonuclease G
MRQGPAFRLSCVLVSFFLAVAAKAADRPSPDSVTGDISLKKTTLTISYNPRHKQANWVFYELGPEQLRNCVQRNDNFRPDPALSDDDSASLADYKGSGFDRGHLSPAADNKWSKESMSESFLLSNVSPQPPRFNQGIWGRLENLVRAWAMKSGGLWVSTGPVLEDSLRSIGRNHVSTPNYFYKVLVSKRTHETLAMLLPTDASGDLSRYAVTVQAVEESSRLNFHEGVGASDERRLESSLSVSDWDFHASYKPLPCRGQTQPMEVPGLFANWQ